MESARAFDAPLPPESERRLARVFCFLRQHERKAKAARKSAELQKLGCGRAAPSSPSSPRSGPRKQHRRDQRRPPSPLSSQTQQLTAGACEDTVHDDDDSDGDSESDDEGPAAAVVALSNADQDRLLNELDALNPARLDSTPHSPEIANDVITDNNNAIQRQQQQQQQAENERRALTVELSREIRELQKGILPTTSARAASAATVSGVAAATGALELSGSISAGDIASAMRAMNRSVSKTEVQWMIWEVDDDLDGCIDWYEFRGCYARTAVDKHGLEANQLYHLIQFLLCDADESFTVSVLEIKAELKKLPGTDHLAAKLLAALKDDAEQQLLQKFTLSEYLDIMLADLPSSSPLVVK